MTDYSKDLKRVYASGDVVFHEKSYAVHSNSQVLVTASIEAFETRADKNPALLTFRFFRNEECLVDLGKIDGISKSDSLGYYSYVGGRGSTGRINFKKLITIPDGVTHIGATIVSWRAPVITVVEAVDVAPFTEQDEDLWASVIRVHDVTQLSLEASLDIAGGHEARAPALVAFAFHDADGAPIVALPKRLSVSKKYGPYVYLGQPGDQGRHDCDLRLPLPRGTASVSMRLIRWGAGSLALAGTPRIALQHVERPGWPESLLAEIDVPVREGESYDFIFRHSSSAVMVDGFALLRPLFLDANGWRVAPADKLPISARMGPYRYFERFGVGADGASQARVNLTIPAGAVRVQAEVHRWRLQDDPGEVAIEAVCLGEDETISMRGQLAYDNSGAAVAFQGKLQTGGGLSRSPGLIEWLFEKRNGERVTTRAKGLASTNRFLNCSTLHCHRDDGVISVRARFVPPVGTRRILWRLRPHDGVTLAPISDFSHASVQDSIEDVVSKLPAAARISRGVDPYRCMQLRSAISTAELWNGVFSSALDLHGEAVATCAANDWLEVGARIEASSAALRPQVVIQPTFFDAEGKVISGVDQPGCRVRKNMGVVRNAALALPLATGANLREAFLAPANAAFAMFHVVLSNPWVDMALHTIEISKISPNAVLADFDTTIMGQPQLADAAEVADAAYNLPARHALAVALASLAPTDPKPANRARALGKDILDLDPAWLPPLPLYPPSPSDPKSILHLLKVIYPDESSGGAVRSTSIVEAQAARGLHPVVCMPLNSPRPSVSLPARDGIDVIERGGVEVCYPHYPGLITKKLGRTERLSLEAILAGRVVRQKQISLIHAASGFRGYENALKGIALARSHNLPLVYEVRSFHEHTWKPMNMPQCSDGITRMRIAQENRCMAAADAVVTISQAMVHNLLERGVPKDKLFFVPNAIDPIFETLPSQDTVEALRAAHALLGKKTIGYISNFAEREGHIVLLDAFTRLVAEGHDIHLVLVGDGEQRARILEQARQRELADRVVMPGNVDHASVRTWYHMIDLFVVPRLPDIASDYVTPLKPFEAMAQNIPVLISDRPVSREIAGDAQERASIFPAGDDRALAGLIAGALADPGRFEARTEEARTWVLAERQWSAVVERYDEVYETARRLHASRTKLAS